MVVLELLLLSFLAGNLKREISRQHFFWVEDRKKTFYLTEEFSKYGEVLVTTEDGTLGEKGLVTNHSIFKVHEFDFDKIYTCGPDPMMKAVAKYCS